jgi:hypothetical protein
VVDTDRVRPDLSDFTPGVWVELPPMDVTPVGQQMVAIHSHALEHAVDVLLTLPGNKRLKVRAGEHLGAILLTAFCGPPVGFDVDGGVDLIFRRDREQWELGPLPEAAVEIKSLPGPWRHVESKIALGDEHSVKVRSAADVLEQASETILAGVEALHQKTRPDCSNHLFLIIHPLDRLAVEVWRDGPFVSNLLPKLSPRVDLDTLWVLWHPEILVKWSSADNRWTEMLFGWHDSEVEAMAQVDGRMGALERAEARFTDGIDYRYDSPWQLRFQ